MPLPTLKQAYMPLGNASVLVEYHANGSSAELMNMSINGMWIDCQDYLPEAIFDRWTQELERGMAEDRQEQAALFRRVMGYSVAAWPDREAA